MTPKLDLHSDKLALSRKRKHVHLYAGQHSIYVIFLVFDCLSFVDESTSSTTEMR